MCFDKSYIEQICDPAILTLKPDQVYLDDLLAQIDKQGLGYEYEERATILEYNGGLPRLKAKVQAAQKNIETFLNIKESNMKNLRNLYRETCRNDYENEMNNDIIQILPATGWQAVFFLDETGELICEPMVCWAIYDRPSLIGREIVGCTLTEGKNVEVDPTDCSQFMCYLQPGQDIPNYIIEKAKRRHNKYLDSKKTDNTKGEKQQ